MVSLRRRLFQLLVEEFRTRVYARATDISAIILRDTAGTLILIEPGPRSYTVQVHSPVCARQQRMSVRTFQQLDGVVHRHLRHAPVQLELIWACETRATPQAPHTPTRREAARAPPTALV